MPTVRFTGITVWKAIFPLRVTFAHNLATRDQAETLLVRVTTEQGAVGFGQALPRAYLTGETMESAAEDIRRLWWPRVRGLELPVKQGVAGALAALAQVFAGADAARRNASYAALDVAAIDAFGNAAGVPVVLHDAGGVSSLPLVGVVPAASPRKAYILARLLRWLGYRHFKVKVGKDAARDAVRIDVVRRAVGNACRIDADANAAWEWDEAVERMRELRGRGIAVVEEPLLAKAAETADFQALEAATGVEIMADESLCTLADAESLLERGSPSWWNVRLAKNGGFAGVSALGELAEKRALKVYGGILVGETGVLAAAGRAALFGIGAKCGEYGFSRFFLRGDPFRGSPAGYRGILRAPDSGTRGLGIRLRDSGLGGDITLLWNEET